MELDLFTNLDGQARSLDEIADGLGVNPKMLRPLLFALTVSELLVEENGNFSNSAEAQEFLVQGKSTFNILFQQSNHLFVKNIYSDRCQSGLWIFRFFY